MLPSTGYFKAIICPFYENGSCERPYCHFKHLRRDTTSRSKGTQSIKDDSTNSSASLPTSQAQMAETSQKVESSGVESAGSSAKVEIHELVNEAVKKLLESQQVDNTKAMADKIVAQVVEQLKPSISGNSGASSGMRMEKTSTAITGKHIGVPSCVTKPAACVYNPTPISELKKRHIPVPVYMPTRESRVAAKRKTSSDSTPKPWLGLLQESGNNSEMTYKPTAIVNTCQEQETSSKTYVPTLRSDNSSSNSYDESNSSDYVGKLKEAYYPKSKKRREEYVPKKVKAPLKSVHQLDDTTLDEFEPEFNMIDEILTSTSSINDERAMVIDDPSDNNYDIEPKFSEDEDDDIQEITDEAERTTTKETPESAKVIEILDDSEENENRALKTKINDSNKNKSEKSSKSHSSHRIDEKSSNKSKEKDKRKERRDSNKSDEKKDDGSRKKEHKSSRKDSERSNKEGSEKSGSKRRHSGSSSGEKSRSSSSKDRNRSKDSRSDDVKRSSSHRSKETLTSKKEKVPSSRSENSKSREKSKQESKHSRSKNSEKHESAKSSSKKHSSSSHKSSKSDSKSRSRKESGSETSINEDAPNSPFGTFIDELMETSDSDHDVEKECLKIFQEYEPTEHPKAVTVKASAKKEPEEKEEIGKRRVAHPSATESIMRVEKPPDPPAKTENPQQRMYDRWRAVKEAAKQKAAENNSITTEANAFSKQLSSVNSINTMSKNAPATSQVNGNGKIRIAHVPYAMALAIKKKKVTESRASIEARAYTALQAKTVAQTAKGSRLAHVPQVVPQLVAPEPLQVSTQKFPINVRQYYVNMMHVICVQIYTSAEDAAQRALREELACHDRCKALPVYKNSCMLATHRLRKELEQGTNGDDSLPSASGIVSHNAVLAGKSKGSWSVEKTKKLVMDFRGVALYERLKKWIASEQQLKDNGYPRPHPDGPKGRAKIYAPNTRNQSIVSKVPNERHCCRCGKAYMVNKHGIAVQQQNCIYHWGRKFTTRGESKYICCQQYGFATGCADAKNHVWEFVDYENLRGYVKTLPKDVPPEEQGVFALDCEMSYTTQGLELTRVTVINEDCNTIYETLVMPEHPIIDYNTRFSGITEENMKGVTTTLLDVQATLLTMFSEQTILVGHSLESDFKALKLIHDTVVDTSIMFPHKNGPPQKRALKNLCSEYLRKIIQNEVGGHDSTEDATACMDLVHWKVKEEAKLQ